MRKVVLKLGITLILTIIILYWIIGTFNRDRVITPDSNRLMNLKNEVQLSTFYRLRIGEIHGKLNSFVGWDNDEMLKDDDVEITDERWEDFRKENLLSTKTLNDLINHISVDAIAEDFRSIRSLLQIARDEEDVNALIYAHRIIHDLDYFVVNTNDGAKYMGALSALEEGKTSKEILKYIDIK